MGPENLPVMGDSEFFPPLVFYGIEIIAEKKQPVIPGDLNGMCRDQTLEMSFQPGLERRFVRPTVEELCNPF